MKTELLWQSDQLSQLKVNKLNIQTNNKWIIDHFTAKSNYTTYSVKYLVILVILDTQYVW